MKLILETLPAFFIEEDKILTILFEEGLDILHLRKSEMLSIYSERLLTLIPNKYYKRIVIHDHFYLKDDFNLMGIHLDQYNSMKPQDYSGHVSCTCFSKEQVKNEKNSYDYVFLTPVYDSISQKEIRALYTSEQLRAAASEKIIDNKVMAMGGVCLDNVMEVRDFGFGGIVVCGDLWNKFDICHGKDYSRLIEHFKLLKKATD
jgi:thiamine-phosphate pyrophosphorylase